MIKDTRLTFNEQDFIRWYKAAFNIEQEVKKIKEELPRKAAEEFSLDLVRNIHNGKFMQGYAMYDPRYASWKAKYATAGGVNNYWKLMGDLVRNVRHFKVKGTQRRDNAYMGGIPGSVYDSGGKSWFGTGNKGKRKKIAMYGFVMEYGGNYARAGNHPARPIITPTTEEYASTKLPRLQIQSLNKLKNMWR